MDGRLRLLADRVARSLWSSVQSSFQRSFDAEDLRQEARLAAWVWSKKRPDCMDTPRDVALTATVIRRRVIDAMRRISPIGILGTDALRPTAKSLDENAETFGESLADESASLALEAVEQAHDFRLAFQQYRTDPDGDADRAAKIAWLNAQGVPLAAIGAHYRISESRVCQLRRKFIDATAVRWAEPGRGIESEAA